MTGIPTQPGQKNNQTIKTLPLSPKSWWWQCAFDSDDNKNNILGVF